MVMKLSEMFIKPSLNLELNVALISNKAPNLHSVICSETNTASITNKRLL